MDTSLQNLLENPISSSSLQSLRDYFCINKLNCDGFIQSTSLDIQHNFIQTKSSRSIKMKISIFGFSKKFIKHVKRFQSFLSVAALFMIFAGAQACGSYICALDQRSGGYQNFRTICEMHEENNRGGSKFGCQQQLSLFFLKFNLYRIRVQPWWTLLDIEPGRNEKRSTH